MRRSLVLVLAATAASAPTLLCAQTAPQPASPQPTVPQQSGGPLPLTSSILGPSASERSGSDLTVRKSPKHRHATARRSHDRHYAEPVDLPRPALAGVTLVQPIPHPVQPPHVPVPVPAYPLENFAAFYTAPPPPVVCRPARRDPDAPDPRLYRERPVICEADNP